MPTEAFKHQQDHTGYMTLSGRLAAIPSLLAVSSWPSHVCRHFCPKVQFYINCVSPQAPDPGSLLFQALPSFCCVPFHHCLAACSGPDVAEQQHPAFLPPSLFLAPLQAGSGHHAPRAPGVTSPPHGQEGTRSRTSEAFILRNNLFYKVLETFSRLGT